MLKLNLPTRSVHGEGGESEHPTDDEALFEGDSDPEWDGVALVDIGNDADIADDDINFEFIFGWLSQRLFLLQRLFQAEDAAATPVHVPSTFGCSNLSVYFQSMFVFIMFLILFILIK